MVSGLVTSPCDHERIFSGEASWILMASKSVMGPVSSNGLERNIFFLSPLQCLARCQLFVSLLLRACCELRCCYCCCTSQGMCLTQSLGLRFPSVLSCRYAS